MTRTAFYAGSFDPPTNGHLDVIRHAYAVAEKLVIAIGIHPQKAPLFSPEERRSMLEEVCWPIAIGAGGDLAIVTFDDLAVTAARRAGATLFIRGLRDGSDLDYEMQLAGMNATLAPDIQTLFMPASIMVRPITATLVRQVAALGGDVSSFVPPAVEARLKARFTRGA